MLVDRTAGGADYRSGNLQEDLATGKGVTFRFVDRAPRFVWRCALNSSIFASIEFNLHLKYYPVFDQRVLGHPVDRAPGVVIRQRFPYLHLTFNRFLGFGHFRSPPGS